MILIPQLIFLLALVVGGVTLQIYLSRKQARWYGLVLPALTFLLSLVTVFAFLSYSSSSSVTVTNEAGEVISQEASQSAPGDFWGTALPIFVVQNLPTLGLLVIYFACRETMKKKRELEKMNIQDLE